MNATRLARPLLHLALALPLAVLLWRWGQFVLGGDARAAGLSSEPVAHTINTLGLWALRALWLTLAITPLRRLLGRAWLASLRRPAGLWAFAYAGLHLSVYFGLDLIGSLDLLAQDVAKRPFILLGMSAFTLLLPLAVTSTRGWIRRIGARGWQRLHRLAYLASGLAAVHFILRVKGFQWEPWIYAGLLAALLAARAWPPRQRAVATS